MDFSQLQKKQVEIGRRFGRYFDDNDNVIYDRRTFI